MTLTEPRAALAENASLIDYLMGLAGLGRLVRALGTGGGAPREADVAASEPEAHAALRARDVRLAWLLFRRPAAPDDRARTRTELQPPPVGVEHHTAASTGFPHRPIIVSLDCKLKDTTAAFQPTLRQ